MLSAHFFYLALSFILMHEMDAIRCKEWRIFPGTNLLDDDMGYKVFLFAHIPLFYFIFYGLFLSGQFEAWRFWLDVFFMIHIFLHLLALRHPKNEFKDWVSWSIIIGAGVFGGLDLLMLNY